MNWHEQDCVCLDVVRPRDTVPSWLGRVPGTREEQHISQLVIAHSCWARIQ